MGVPPPGVQSPVLPLRKPRPRIKLGDLAKVTELVKGKG